MKLESPTTLILCGKSSPENELARFLKINNTIKLPDNASINVVLHSENEEQESFQKDAFQIDSYMNSLSTSRVGRFLIYSPILPTTHDIVSQWAIFLFFFKYLVVDSCEFILFYSVKCLVLIILTMASNFCELPLGTVCVADVQLKGRGRSKNVWESPKGCLMFSFSLQMEDGRVVPLVQYVVCLAMAEAINDVCLRNGIPPLNVRIKWPNDLYLDGLKVGGILCTSTYTSKKFNVSAGIGVNVSNEKPTTCLNAVIQRLTSVAYQLQREDIMAAFFNKFENYYDIFQSQGFQALEELYYKTWLHSGQRVIVQEKKENQDQISENVVAIQVN
ncbi:biotin--protein ligase 2-like isoform X1 [Olea europaea var. sylvestris]|uniref:biotin--protein ligase 2-like isoform X1 n=1 Tax=Olea europaea var. sylvestris TaxID=158386 RepID=UPI000C1D735C|nr:biotin--protein ligase 2-like isoform X1 [Olea europaea var. sylvestris]XP_022863681.1 biotin--protein ligase 2-like isoform X1 [Olea europaea var. sylvestris]